MKGKYVVVVFVVLAVVGLVALNQTASRETNSENETLSGTISLSGAWALYPMVVQWSQEFQKLYPEVKFDIAAGGAGKGMADALAKVVDLGMVSRDIYEAEIEKGAWWVSVTKDAVVPTINANNPLLPALAKTGVTREEFVDLFITGKVAHWGQLLNQDPGAEVHVFTRSDACGAAKTWAKYLGHSQEDLLGVGVYGDPGVAEAVAQDVAGAGYNNINFAFDPETKAPMQGIAILPIDLNGNGTLDADEAFVDSRDALVAAIATGRYPSPPARDLHLVRNGAPDREVVRVFLQWVLHEGQAFIDGAGYIPLSAERLQTESDKL